jgi:starvation-inducible DNA-binding protein
MDEIAERILTLGQAPDHRYSTYLKDSMVKESGIITDGNQAVDQILVALESIIILQRSLLNQSAEADDEGTNALMSDYIREQEKLVWMYAAFRNQ